MAKAKTSMSDKIRAALKAGKTPNEVAKKLGIKAAYVYQVRWQDAQKKNGKKAGKKVSKKKLVSKKQDDAATPVETVSQVVAMVEARIAHDQALLARVQSAFVEPIDAD